MFNYELKAAGLRGGFLLTAYQACGKYLSRRNPAAYPVARLLLPPGKRPYYDAMLAFAGYVDDLLDDRSQTIEARNNNIIAFDRQFFGRFTADLDNTPHQPPSSQTEGQLISAAFSHFATTWSVPPDSIRLFLDTIRVDLQVTCYPTFDDLERHMSGVSREPGLWVNTLLEGQSDESAQKATALGYGVYLLDFLADIREDIDLGRVYLPLEDLRRYGISRADLESAARRRQITEPLREVIAYQAARIRQYFDDSDGWDELVTPSCRELPRQYLNLGRNDLRLLARSDHDVFQPRLRPRLARLGYAHGSTLLSYLQATRDRRRYATLRQPQG
jgi:phytoene synthase